MNEPLPEHTAVANAVTAVGHLLMALIAVWYFPDRRRPLAVACVAGFMAFGTLMHCAAAVWMLPEARWVLAVRSVVMPLIVYGWFVLIRSARRSADKLAAVDAELATRSAGPDTQRMIDARVLMEKLAGIDGPAA